MPSLRIGSPSEYPATMVKDGCTFPTSANSVTWSTCAVSRICKCVLLELPHIQGVRSQSAKLSQFSLEKLSSGQNWAVHSECLFCLSLRICQPLLSSARLKQNFHHSRVPFHQSFIESLLVTWRAAFALVSCGTLLLIITIMRLGLSFVRQFIQSLCSLLLSW